MNGTSHSGDNLPAKPLLQELRGLIQGARERVARIVNKELVVLYWNIGRRIRADVLGAERAKYGEEIVSTLSRQLREEFGIALIFSACCALPSCGRTKRSCPRWQTV